MGIIAADMKLAARPLQMTDSPLPTVRRLEAVGFRSWPSATTRYDGAWCLRLTASHSSKRLNSINCLDAADTSDIDRRLLSAAREFENFGRPVILRQTPLTPQPLVDVADENGWARIDTTDVMRLDLASWSGADDAVLRLPHQDRGHWLDQAIAIGEVTELRRAGMAELLANVQGEVALFLSEDTDGAPQAVAMAVRFADLLGLFTIASHPHLRGQGHGRSILRSALAWGAKTGARRAWLAVEATNTPARRLYEAEGFAPVYDYTYWQAPDGYFA